MSKKYIQYTIFILFALSLAPWLSTYISQMVNVDIAFLTLSAERLLAGEPMSEAYYDTNPPLSIIVQIPPALLSKITELSLYHSISIYIFALLSLSIVVSNLLLKKIPDISENQRLLMIMAFIITNTIMSGYDFGQKDYLLGIYLFPLVLVQILITMRIKINPTLKWFTLLAGSLLILLKPHYGLIPATIFLHRMIYQRRFNIFKDPDFLCLAGMAIAYISIIFLFFGDFIEIILPDIVMFYAADISIDIVYMGIIASIVPLACAAISYFIFKDLPKLIPAFFMISALCIIPFILQGKGWLYHLLPASMIFSSAFIILFERLMRLVLSDLKTENKIQATSLAIVILTITSITIYSGITQPNIPIHKQYKETEFAKIINKCASENNGKCPFLIMNDMINMPHELSVYTGQKHASRFPYFWFVPYLINAKEKYFMLKYSNMIVEDLEKYEPKIIFVGNFPNLVEEGKSFNFLNYFLKNSSKFKNIWNNYNFKRTITIDRIKYMKQKKPDEKLINYDIYKRKAKVEK